MKRVFYIANAYDGAYFVLTDDIEIFYRRMASYALNLKNSTKCNTYTFGSVEMTQSEYLRKTTEAESFEAEQIEMTKKEREVREPAQQESKEGADNKPKKNGLYIV